jgi:hypothetical protein
MKCIAAALLAAAAASVAPGFAEARCPAPGERVVTTGGAMLIARPRPEPDAEPNRCAHASSLAASAAGPAGESLLLIVGLPPALRRDEHLSWRQNTGRDLAALLDGWTTGPVRIAMPVLPNGAVRHLVVTIENRHDYAPILPVRPPHAPKRRAMTVVVQDQDMNNPPDRITTTLRMDEATRMPLDWQVSYGPGVAANEQRSPWTALVLDRMPEAVQADHSPGAAIAMRADAAAPSPPRWRGPRRAAPR